MSTVPNLTQSVNVLVALGLLSHTEAAEVEHCVDDAVYTLESLTNEIEKHPEVFNLLKESIQLDKMNNILNNYTLFQDRFDLLPNLIPDYRDATIHFEKEPEEDNKNVRKVYVSSEELGFSSKFIGLEILKDSINFVQGQIAVPYDIIKELNQL